jgi:hypothetical protein
MSLYALALAGSNYFAPVISGFISDGQGWQWVFYWPSIFLTASFVFLFVSMEETSYTRTPTLQGTGLPQESKITVTTEGKQKVPAPVESTEFERAISTSQPLYLDGKVPTFWQKLSLWHPQANLNILKGTVRVLEYLGWPIIFFCGFSYGNYLISFTILNGTASIILGGPPYNFSPSITGVSYLSCCLGVITGSFYSGKCSDWLMLKLARRNAGVSEAEHRLWPFSLCAILVPTGMLLWGVGAANGIHWFGLVVGMAILAFTSTVGLTISVNYLIDSYREISGDAMASVILVRNTMSFAVSYG